MDPELREELAAVVVGFLQQSYKESPEGYTIKDFERIFPEKADEPPDWYKSYKCNSVLKALEAIQDHVVIRPGQRGTMVSLNPKSDKIDKDLMKLIINQKSSNKKKKPGQNRRPNRAIASFKLNTQYAPRNHNQIHTSRRLNQGYTGGSGYRNESISTYKKIPDPPRPTLYNRPTPNNSYDPRGSPAGRYSSVPSSQPRYPPIQQRQPTTPQPTYQSQQQQPRFQPSQPTPARPAVVPPTVQSVADSQPIFRRRDRDNTSSTRSGSETIDDPELVKKKEQLRQRLVWLLSKKHTEIKLIHLKNLYKLQFEKDLNPVDYGCKSIPELMNDTTISQYIKLNIDSPIVTISLKNKTYMDGKENINSNHDLNCNSLAQSQGKLEAIEPFNLKNMLNTLEPFTELTKQLSMNTKIDDLVKYKTVRIVFSSPNGILKLDDWEARYEQQSRLRLRVRDFGFKTPLEFFKNLAKEAPIKISLNSNDEWIAIIDMVSLMDWVNDELSKGRYRAMMAMESVYEIVAFPDELYTYNNLDSLIDGDSCPVAILSAKRSNSMWIQIRESKQMEEHLLIEASMTCYQDYKNKGLLTASIWFIRAGFPCAVFDSSQQRWCRGLILKAPDVVDKNYEVEVLLVDYAITKTIPISELLCLLRTHLKRPVGPIYSRLRGINEKDPLIRSQAKRILHEYTNPPVTLACKFFAKTMQDPSSTPKYLPQYIADIELIDTRQREDKVLANLIAMDGESPQSN